ADGERDATRFDVPSPDGSHALLTTDLARLYLLALITKHGVARHHFDRQRLREAIDQTLGQTIGQILRIGVAIGVREGQHRERVDHLRAAVQVEPYTDREHGQERGEREDGPPRHRAAASLSERLARGRAALRRRLYGPFR